MNFKGLKWTRNKRFEFALPPTVCVFFRCLNQHFGPSFYNIDFAMYSVQPVKICLKNVNFKGLKWTRTQKFKWHFCRLLINILILFFINIILSKCFMRIIFKNFLFLFFLVKKQSLYLCNYINFFLFLKPCWGPHVWRYTHNFFCEVLEDPK